jgi:hypothetical protein
MVRLDNGGYRCGPSSRVPRELFRTVVSVGDAVETQLRDLAILAMIGLLLVLTLQVLWLTSGRRDEDRKGR